jgi:two-component sensor histidine kinase
MTLRHRLSLLVAAALVPPLLLILYNVVRSQVALDREARSEVLVSARQISAELAQMIEATRQLIAVMGKHPAISADEPTCAAYFKTVIAELPLYREAAMIDPAGKLRCSTVPAPMSLEMRDSLYLGERTPVHQLTIRALAPVEAEWPSLQVSMPVAAADGSPKGAIGLVLNTEGLALDLEGRSWKSRHRILVLDREGSVVFTIPRDEVETAKQIAADISSQPASASAGVIDARSFEGRPEIVAFASVEKIPLSLLTAVAIDRNMASAEARYTNVRSLTLAAITGILAIACTWVATHILINRPIRTIVQTAHRLEAGDIGVTFPRINVSTEFGQLSTSLSRMSGRINELLEQRSLLLRELQHRVMNSLTLLSSVLEIQRRNVPDAGAREHLARARDRVVAMGTIYRDLYQTDTPNEVEFSRFLNAICRESQNAYAGPHKRTIAVEAEPLKLSGSTAIALAMTTHELITNALKHAYPEGKSGPITVKFVRSEDGGIELRVGDQGRGLPPDFEIGKSTSLGMKVVASTASQLGGTIEANRLEPGTEFVIRLPSDILHGKQT